MPTNHAVYLNSVDGDGTLDVESALEVGGDLVLGSLGALVLLDLDSSRSSSRQRCRQEGGHGLGGHFERKKKEREGLETVETER